MLLLQGLEAGPRFHRALPVSWDHADLVVARFHIVEWQVDANARGRACGADAVYLGQRPLRKDAVGRYRDHLGPAFLVWRDDQFVQVGTKGGFPAGERDVERGVTQVAEDFPPFVNAQVIVRLAPHVAGATLAVAAKADADHEAEGKHIWPAEVIEAPIER